MGHRRIETRELGKIHKGGASESNGKFEWELSGQTSKNGWHFGQRDSWQMLEACRNTVCDTTFVLVCRGGSLYEVHIGGKGLAAYEVINGVRSSNTLKCVLEFALNLRAEDGRD